MTLGMDGACWTIGGATVIGAAHRRRDLANQDAIGWSPPDGGRSFVAAVSDGHGAAPHFRSDIGSKLAIRAAVAVLEWCLADDTSDATIAGLPAQIVHAWQNAVQEDAGLSVPAGNWIEPKADKLLAYGATLVATAITPALAIAFQIGDGDLYWGFADGRISRPLPDDLGLVGEQTYSLCAPDAPVRGRLVVLRAETDVDLPCFAMLTTDGVSKSFADIAAFEQVVRHYRQALGATSPATVLDRLPGWLEAVSAGGSGDDATLCLAIRQPA